MAGAIDKRLGVSGAGVTKEQCRARARQHARAAGAAAQRLVQLNASFLQMSFFQSPVPDPTAPCAAPTEAATSAAEDRRGSNFGLGTTTQE